MIRPREVIKSAQQGIVSAHVHIHVCACMRACEVVNPWYSLSLSVVVDEWLGVRSWLRNCRGPEALQCVYHSN